MDALEGEYDIYNEEIIFQLENFVEMHTNPAEQ